MKIALRTTLVLAFISLPLAADILSGDILISNHSGSNVQLLHPADGSVTTLVSVSGTPIGLAFDKSGNLYINDGNGIDKYVPSTNTLTSAFFTGTGAREGLTFDPVTDHLFSVSFGANHIEEVDLSGNLIRTITIPGTGNLLGISARGGDLAITDYSTGGVFVGSTGGSSFSMIGTVDPANTYAPDFDASGNVYVNDFAGKVVKFTNLGGGSYSGKADFITGLSGPDNGLSIGDDGSFTISEFNANRVDIYNNDGSLRTQFPGVASPDELVVFAPIRTGGGGEAVPEPGSLALLGSALLALGFFARRAKPRVAPMSDN